MATAGKHTPGEWKLDPKERDAHERRDEVYVGDIERGTTICVIESGNRFDGHLIAASVRTKEALRASTDMLREELRVHLKSYCIVADQIDSIADAADRLYVRRLHNRVTTNEALIAESEGRECD